MSRPGGSAQSRRRGMRRQSGAQRGSKSLRNLFQRHAFRFNDLRLHPDELQNHHAGEERKYVSGWKCRNDFRKQRRQNSREYPVSETSQRLTLRAMLIWKDFGNINPNRHSLTNGMGRDEREDADRNDGIVFGKKCVRDKAKRSDVAE